METKAPAPRAAIMQAARSFQKAAYLIDEGELEKNCAQLQRIAQESGAKIVLAQKAFATPQIYPLIGRYLDGACASGVWEARLAREYFPAGAEVITCAPAYSDEDIEELLPLSDHLDFNSLSQWRRYRTRCLEYDGEVLFGLRINPEYSTGETELYDPCAPGSRLGTPLSDLLSCDASELEGLSGLHFHTLCEQGVEDLEKTLEVVEQKCASLLHRMKYLNLGGGHWITKPGYGVDRLITLIRRLRETYDIEVYLEPGEAVAIHSGVLVARVLDIHQNGCVKNALLDVSATAHMPDVLEMPYRPDVYDVRDGREAQETGEYEYRLTGCTCLAGDQIGDYAFAQPLSVGDLVLFNDMAHYTLVKTTFFNGVKHPDIYVLREEECLLMKEYSYRDYRALK